MRDSFCFEKITINNADEHKKLSDVKENVLRDMCELSREIYCSRRKKSVKYRWWCRCLQDKQNSYFNKNNENKDKL